MKKVIAVVVLTFFLYALTSLLTVTQKQAFETAQRALENYCKNRKISCDGFETNGAYWDSEIHQWSVQYYDERMKHAVDFTIPLFGLFIETSYYIEDERKDG